jgi:hypothetical protein
MPPSLKLLQELIEIGRTDEARIPSSLGSDGEFIREVLCGNAPWMELGATIDNSVDLACLIRGFVLYSRTRGAITSGSCSPVIPLYRCFRERFPTQEAALTTWIVGHRRNPYEPFGTMNDGESRTYAEFQAWQASGAGRVRGDTVAEMERQEKAREIRKQRATERLPAAVRRGDLGAVKALLAKGADTTTGVLNGKSLVALAEEHGRTAVAECLRAQGVQ